jgi:hypothetical protein
VSGQSASRRVRSAVMKIIAARLLSEAAKALPSDSILVVEASASHDEPFVTDEENNELIAIDTIYTLRLRRMITVSSNALPDLQKYLSDVKEQQAQEQSSWQDKLLEEIQKENNGATTDATDPA